MKFKEKKGILKEKMKEEWKKRNEGNRKKIERKGMKENWENIY